MFEFYANLKLLFSLEWVPFIATECVTDFLNGHTMHRLHDLANQSRETELHL